VLVDDIRLKARDEQWELSGRVTMERLDTEGLRIWFRFPAEYSTGELDASPFLPSLLVTSMWWNEALVIDGPVSARLLANVDEGISLYRCLFPSLSPVSVAAPSHELTRGGAVTACFFSRGVDSWYSVLKNLEKPDPRRPPLTHLVHVPSVDFMYGDENRSRSMEATRTAAEEVGCQLVMLETNLRHFTERFQHWGIAHGGGLAGMGLVLGAAFSHVLLASSAPVGKPNLFGSQLALDQVWSTERTTVVHDGAEARRLDKTRFISDHEEVLRNLKVCFVTDTALNCGQCEKCLVTMIGLHIAGVLERCPAFDRSLDPRAVARMPSPGWQRFFFTEVLEELGNAPLDVAVKLALEKVLLREELHLSVGRVRRLTQARLAPLRARLARLLLAGPQRR
jgi:hypothetical protein